jgi:hypothetical protein
VVISAHRQASRTSGALRQTLALKLDGAVSGRDEELATALRILGRDSGTG